MEISCREINKSDLDEMAALYVETFRSSPWNEGWTLDTAKKRLRQILNTDGFYGWCAYCQNGLCGVILGGMEQFYHGTLFQIKEFWVKNGMRGHGVGTELFQAFEKRLKAKGVSEIILFTSKGDATEHFYHKQHMLSNDNMVFMQKQL